MSKDTDRGLVDVAIALLELAATIATDVIKRRSAPPKPKGLTQAELDATVADADRATDDLDRRFAAAQAKWKDATKDWKKIE